MLLNLDHSNQGKVSVLLDAQRARAGAVFATKAMKNPQVPDTKPFPKVRIKSRQIMGNLLGADVLGDLILRAGLYRQQGRGALTATH